MRVGRVELGVSGLILELMSNGTLARLPQAFVPEGVPVPGGPFVMLLLPHNRYLLGHPTEGGGERWEWGRPGDDPQEVFLYDDEPLALAQDDTVSIVLPTETVTLLKRELMAQLDPPGDHLSTVLVLRGFMKDRAAFMDGSPFQDEPSFVQSMGEDDVLRKIYWALRLALARGEFDAVTRLKAWLRAGPELFDKGMRGEDAPMKVWFSILDVPDDASLQELSALSFSREDLQHMVAQRVVPLLLFNPRSGYLVLSRFGKDDGTGFFVWAFVRPHLWGELRERRKLSVREVVLALWGQWDIENAIDERSRYAPGLEGVVSLPQG